MEELGHYEKYWVDRQPWLLSLGYQLRPRFRPGWVPSWVTHPTDDFREMNHREDYITQPMEPPTVDALRLSDNTLVMMKFVISKECDAFYKDDEQAISEFASSPEQRQDPDNHCVPIIEILRDPQRVHSSILVMPLLREWTSPRLDTVGEALDMIHQAFMGLRYLHQNHIVHRDCTGFNFMMDGSGMYPDGFHPFKQDHNIQFTGPAIQKYTRTQRPPTYYWIDFGLSVCFDESDNCPRAIPVRAGDKSPPEHTDLNVMRDRGETTDPFLTDIYYLGNMVRMFFTEGSKVFHTEGKHGFEFLEPLVNDMVQDDPTKRPNIDECVKRLEKIIRAQSSWTLRSQVWDREDVVFATIIRFFPHWARRIVYIITRTPAIPSRRSPPSPYLPVYTRIVLGLWYMFVYGFCIFPQYFIGPITFLPFFFYLWLYVFGMICLLTLFGPILFTIFYPMYD